MYVLALSIRNDETEKLAREVAETSGETITQAITSALEERLERLRGRAAAPDLGEQLLKISERCRSIPDLDSRSADEILGYDSEGVPRS